MIHSLLWFIVAIVATTAVYSRQIHDTLSERLGLALVAFAAFAAGSRAWNGLYYSPTGDLSLAFAFAFYGMAIAHKHVTPFETELPKDKCKKSLTKA